MEIKQMLDNKINEITNLYYTEKFSSIKIGALFGVSHSAILDCLERHGYKRRVNHWANVKYTINENYFNIIDAPAKAYLLGFLYADGCLYKNSLILKIQERDRKIVEILKKELNTNKPIRIIDPKKNNKFKNQQKMVSLTITNTQITTDIKKLGISERKSLILEFPNNNQVPDELIHHFVRGYLDGDGSIIIPKGKISHCQIAICLTKAFGETLKNILKKNNIKSSLGLHERNSKIHRLSIGGRKQCLRFLEWVYSNHNNIYLDRKYEKFIQIKNHQNKKKKLPSSKYMGVYFVVKKKKFLAKVERLGKVYYFGSFDNEIDAAKAYNKGIQNLGIDRELNAI